ncbi:MAG: ABC transporter substrate-binding protein [Bacteroidetes bacterium]|nr:ABC transporter substrate-binding protein [Bacteroidota bacterium]
MRFFCLFLLIPTWSLTLSAQVSATRLLEYWKQGNYDWVAREAFQSTDTTGLARLMGLKSLNRTGRFTDAYQMVRSGTFRFSQTRYETEWWYEAGVAAYQLMQSADAFRFWMKSYRLTPDSQTGDHIRMLLFTELTVDESVTLLSENTPFPADPWLPWLRALAASSQQLPAVDGWMIRNGLDPASLPATNTASIPMKKVRIGVLLPFFENADSLDGTEEPGREVLRGFLLRLEETIREWGPSVTVIFKDTRSDPELAAKLAAELISIHRVNLIVGPLFSDECLAVRDLAIQHRIPVITPTATRDDLFAGSSYLFTMNTTLKTRGRIAAEQVKPLIEEAIRLNKTRSARLLLVAEEASDAEVMAASFASLVAEVDSAKVTTALFPADSPDIRRYIPFGREDDPDTLDFIYAPASDPEQAELMVSHISYMRILGNYIVNSAWNTEVIYKKFRVQTAMTVMVNDWAIDTTVADYARFKADYRSVYGGEPGVLAFRGADGADFTAWLIRQGIPGHTEPDAALRSLPVFNGFTGPIWFNGQVSNQAIPILRRQNGSWVPYEPKGLPFH